MRIAAVLIALFLPGLASAVTCENARYEGNRYTICTVRPAEENLRLFLRDDAGEILGQFSSIEASLPEGQTLSFGMNAGMYHLDRRPVGLYLEEGRQESKLYPNSGPGSVEACITLSSRCGKLQVAAVGLHPATRPEFGVLP